MKTHKICVKMIKGLIAVLVIMLTTVPFSPGHATEEIKPMIESSQDNTYEINKVITMLSDYKKQGRRNLYMHHSIKGALTNVRNPALRYELEGQLIEIEERHRSEKALREALVVIIIVTMLGIVIKRRRTLKNHSLPIERETPTRKQPIKRRQNRGDGNVTILKRAFTPIVIDYNEGCNFEKERVAVIGYAIGNEFRTIAEVTKILEIKRQYVSVYDNVYFRDNIVTTNDGNKYKIATMYIGALPISLKRRIEHTKIDSNDLDKFLKSARSVEHLNLPKEILEPAVRVRGDQLPMPISKESNGDWDLVDFPSHHKIRRVSRS